MSRTHAMLEFISQASKMMFITPKPCFSLNHSSNRSKGYSLAELLIGLGVSSLVVGLALNLYQLCRQSWQFLAAVDTLYQNAQVAFRAIERQAELEGAAYFVSSSDNHVLLSTPYPSMITQHESLLLMHWAGADLLDCQGNASANPSNMISNSFKRNTHNELSCKDTNALGSNYQAIAEGVEDLQIRFAHINPLLNTLQWRNASELFGPAEIVAIEVCLRMVTPMRITSTVHHYPSSKAGCREEMIATDGRLRRVFRRVIALRNRFGVYG